MSYLNKIYSLWYFDLQSRRRFQILTIVIAFGYGIFNSLALGRPEKQVSLETLVLVFFLTAAFTVFYCLRTTVDSALTKPNLIIQHRRFFELGLASAIVLAIASLIASLPSQKVQAASIDLQLTRALSSKDPDASQTINRISDVIRQATDKQVPIRPALLDAVGKKLLEASKKNPGAWQPVLEVLGYRSGTLEFSYTVDVQFLPVPKQRFIVLKALGKDVPNVKAFGRAMMDSPEAAIVDSISSPAVRASDTGFESVLLSGETMLLDDAHLKHVVLKDVEVHYNGGPVILEDVTFVNCRFVFAEDNNARALASAILTSPKVDFRIG